MPTGFTPTTGQSHVNTANTRFVNFFPDVGALADGGYVVVYQSTNVEGGVGAQGIYLQRYDANGAKVGGETAVATTVSPAGSNVWEEIPNVIGLADGGFLVTWDAYLPDATVAASPPPDPTYSGIFAQRFDASGATVGSSFKVSSYPADYHWQSDVTELTGGGFLFTWASRGQDGDGFGVYAQILDASYAPVGGEFQINTTTTGYQGNPDVIALAGGGFVVAWASWSSGATTNGATFQQFDAAGVAIGGETLIAGEGTPAITALDTGGFVATWASYDGNGLGISAQIYDANGAKVGTEFAVNSTTAYDQKEPDITTLADGSFIITWASYWLDGSQYGIVGQQFSATGTTLGPEFRISSSWGEHSRPSIDALAGGGFIVTWQSDEHILHNEFQVYSQIFSVGNYLDPIIGTAASESLSDIFGVNLLDGLGGDDLMYGLTGDDQINGSAGNDEMYGGAGNDTIDGGANDDVAYGGNGNDILFGGTGNDTLNGDHGQDTLWGDDGVDTLNGGDGVDALHGGGQNDTLNGGNHNDSLWGDLGDDTLNGDAGDDLLRGGAGADAIFGGFGDDRIWGGTGDDTADGGDGADWAFGGTGNDTLSGGDGNDVLLGGLGSDTLNGGLGDDSLKGNKGHDFLHGNAGADTLLGGNGDDSLWGGNGDDALNGGKGADTLWGDGGNDLMRGKAGNDTLHGGAGADSLIGGIGNDALFGNTGDDKLRGGGGKDVLEGNEGADVLRGGAGSDTLNGGAGKDLLIGGSGADVFIFNATTDSASHNMLFDRIADFASGLDQLDFSAISGGAAFAYIGTAGFSAAGTGEARSFTTALGGTLMALDVDGDGLADMKIIFNGSVGFAEADFIW